MSQEQEMVDDGAESAPPQPPQDPEKVAQQEADMAKEQPKEGAKLEKDEANNIKAAQDAAAEKPTKKGPSGGYDSSPIPSAPPGYTIKITVHRGENLPMADLNAFSSDPYCLLQLNADTDTRHKEDPNLRWRTTTIRKSTTPVWNEDWIIANVPSSGFKLKIRIYDEDPADQDDLLGRVHLTVPSLDENWPGIKNEPHKLKAYGGSYRAYLLQAITTCFRQNKEFRGHLHLSIELLGRTPEDGQSGRLYTIGPCRWTRHYSPLLGRLLGIEEPDKTKPEQTSGSSSGNQPPDQKKVERYNFQANQIQLAGPVPADLYHRYVEFKPWVSRMFTSKGVSGMVLGKALHHQHTRVYNFGRSTAHGSFPQGPCKEMTQQFLDLVHWDHGGRIFTYVITLDALWRFTETGKEFGIDMLSKHTMHSDVSIYIAFSGEFFIRRLKYPNRPPPPDPAESSSQSKPPEHEQNEEHPPKDISGGAPSEESPKDPKFYELVIDNDSGTYRPNADLLPILKAYLARQLPGLHILTLDCNKDAEKQQAMKKEQRERKKKEGDHIIYTMGSRSSSVSSSDVEDLNRLQGDLEDEDAVAREHGPSSQAVKDAKSRNMAKVEKAKTNSESN